MKKNLINIAVAATLGCTAFTAAADDVYRGAWYAVPGVSYMDTDGDLEANNGGGAFIKLGKELSPRWDIQGGFSYNRASEDTDIPGLSGRYKQTALGLDALYMFSRDKFRPFLLAGLGVARNDVDYSILGDGKKTSWMANIGLGAQYLFNDTFGLQADLRHQWSRANGEVGDGDIDTIGNTLFNLGAIFRFAAPTPVPVAEVAAAPAPVPATPEPAPAPEPEPAPVVAEPCKPQFETITVSAEKLFGFDQSTLNGDGKTELNAAADKLKANPDVELVMVTGHTDRIGSEAYNQKLSERRASTVRDYMISQGVEANRLQAAGKGESEPVVACDGVKGRKLIECLQPNRRVVLSAEKQRATACK